MGTGASGKPKQNPRRRRIRWSRVRRRGSQQAQTAGSLPVLRTEDREPSATAGGPGQDAASPSAWPRVTVTSIDYAPSRCEYEEVTNIPDFLDAHRPEWSVVRWINVDGFSDPDVILAFAEKYRLHPLAVEDLFHGHQRPKAEDYPASDDQPGRLFVIARMVYVEDGYLCDEQIGFFLGRHTLITFQEEGGDVFDTIRQRIKNGDVRLRSGDVSVLLHALLDAIVDRLFPLLEECSQQLESLERIVFNDPRRQALRRIHRVRRELLLLRRMAWPMRELLNQLQREPRVCLSESTRVYFRDIYDHLTQVIELLETYRDFLIGITETYMSSAANRMNEIMKTLTIITTIFVPLTFLAGVYGMNMPIPENAWAWSYPIFWGFCVVLSAGMLYWFRRREWF